MTCRTAARPSASRRFQFCPLRLRGRPAALVAWNTSHTTSPGRPAPAPTTLYLKRRRRRRRAAGLTRRRRAHPAKAPRLPRPGPPSLELRWCARARRRGRRLRRCMRKPHAVAATRCRGDGVTLDALPRRWRPRRPKKKTPLKTVEERRRPVLLGGVLGHDGRDALDGAAEEHET